MWFGGGFSCHVLSSFQPHFQCNHQPCQLIQCLQVKRLLPISINGLCRYKHEQARVPQLFLIAKLFPLLHVGNSSRFFKSSPKHHTGTRINEYFWVPPLYRHSDPHSLSGSPLAMLNQMSSSPKTSPVLKLSHVLNSTLPPIFKQTKTIGPLTFGHSHGPGTVSLPAHVVLPEARGMMSLITLLQKKKLRDWTVYSRPHTWSLRLQTPNS